MKKIITGLLMLIGITSVQAQEYEYVPLVREGMQWVYAAQFNGCQYDRFDTYYTLQIKGDTVISGIPFKKLIYELSQNTPSPIKATLAYVREEDKIVYAVMNQNFDNQDPLYSYPFPVIKSENYNAFGEYIIYNFNDIIGFFGEYDLPLEEGEMVSTNNGNRRYYHVTSTEGDPSIRKPGIVEGVGFDGGSGNLIFFTWSKFINCPKVLNCGLIQVVDENGTIELYGRRYEELKDYLTPTNVENVRNDNRSQSDTYYNLLGEPVSRTKPTTPGIYIKGCKKFVIK